MKEYDWICNYKNGFARVVINGRWGFINRQGREICEIKYDDVIDFFETGYGMVLVDGKVLYIDGNGIEYDKVEKHIRRNK